MKYDAEQEYFSDGITEEIINVLTHVPTLKVVGYISPALLSKEKIRTYASLVNN